MTIIIIPYSVRTEFVICTRASTYYRRRAEPAASTLCCIQIVHSFSSTELSQVYPASANSSRCQSIYLLLRWRLLAAQRPTCTTGSDRNCIYLLFDNFLLHTFRQIYHIPHTHSHTLESPESYTFTFSSHRIYGEWRIRNVLRRRCERISRKKITNWERSLERHINSFVYGAVSSLECSTYVRRNAEAFISHCHISPNDKI